MVKRKIINDHRLIPFMKQVIMDEVEDILSQDSNVQIKVSLLTNLLRSFKIPLGVEGGSISKIRRIHTGRFSVHSG